MKKNIEKIQKEIKKDMKKMGVPMGYQQTWSEQRYQSLIKTIIICYTIAMIWAITLSIITTLIILHNYGTKII